MADVPKLLPCPFCGSEKHMLLEPTCTKSDPYNPNDRAFPMIRCGGCFTDVPGKDWDASGKTAVERWNTRPLSERESRTPDVVTDAMVAIYSAAHKKAVDDFVDGSAPFRLDLSTEARRAGIAAVLASLSTSAGGGERG